MPVGCVRFAVCVQPPSFLYGGLCLFLNFFFNILFDKLCLFSHRRDHIREEQSLRICQGHPNIVKLQEVFQDDVSILQGFFNRRGCLDMKLQCF